MYALRFGQPCEECFLLSKALLGLGGSYWRCHRHTSKHAVERKEHSVPVHVHHAGVLSTVGQTVHCVAAAASHPQHTPTLPVRTQVSLRIPVMWQISWLESIYSGM